MGHQHGRRGARTKWERGADDRARRNSSGL